MKKLLSMFCALCLFLTVAQAQATTFSLLESSTDYYVGLITPDVPASSFDEGSRVDHLIKMNINTTETYDEQTLIRSSLAGLPDLFGMFIYSGKDETGNVNFSATSNGDYYILAKYDHLRAGALVWFVDDAIAGDSYDLQDKLNTHELSHFTVWRDSTPVPEPGTLLLLGGGLFGLAIFGKRRMNI